jgi:hypothetical protein
MSSDENDSVHSDALNEGEAEEAHDSDNVSGNEEEAGEEMGEINDDDDEENGEKQSRKRKVWQIKIRQLEKRKCWRLIIRSNYL